VARGLKQGCWSDGGCQRKDLDLIPPGNLTKESSRVLEPGVGDVVSQRREVARFAVVLLQPGTHNRRPDPLSRHDGQCFEHSQMVLVHPELIRHIQEFRRKTICLSGVGASGFGRAEAAAERPDSGADSGVWKQRPKVTKCRTAAENEDCVLTRDLGRSTLSCVDLGRSKQTWEMNMLKIRDPEERHRTRYGYAEARWIEDVKSPRVAQRMT